MKKGLALLIFIMFSNFTAYADEKEYAIPSTWSVMDTRVRSCLEENISPPPSKLEIQGIQPTAPDLNEYIKKCIDTVDNELEEEIKIANSRKKYNKPAEKSKKVTTNIRQREFIIQQISVRDAGKTNEQTGACNSVYQNSENLLDIPVSKKTISVLWETNNLISSFNSGLVIPIEKVISIRNVSDVNGELDSISKNMRSQYGKEIFIQQMNGHVNLTVEECLINLISNKIDYIERIIRDENKKISAQVFEENRKINEKRALELDSQSPTLRLINSKYPGLSQRKIGSVSLSRVVACTDVSKEIRDYNINKDHSGVQMEGYFRGQAFTVGMIDIKDHLEIFSATLGSAIAYEDRGATSLWYKIQSSILANCPQELMME